MPKATADHTPSRRGLLGGSVAAAATAALALAPRPTMAASPQAPGGRAFALGRQMRELARHHDEMDRIILGMPDGPERDAFEQQFEMGFERIAEIGRDAASVPAETLGDVCVQAAVVLGAAEFLLNSYAAAAPADDEELVAMMVQASASIVVATSRLGGIDLDSIWWSDLARLAKSHVAGGEVA